MNRQGGIKKVLVLILLLATCFFVVAKYVIKTRPYAAHITCQNGNCYAFIETGRRSLWYELCRKSNLALKELQGFLKERKDKTDEL